MYDTGRGVRQDDTEAVRWYRMAAAQGLADVQSNLARMYVVGRPETLLSPLLDLFSNDVREDFVEAHMWYNLAAEQSSGDPRELLEVDPILWTGFRHS